MEKRFITDTSQYTPASQVPLHKQPEEPPPHCPRDASGQDLPAPKKTNRPACNAPFPGISAAVLHCRPLVMLNIILHHNPANFNTLLQAFIPIRFKALIRQSHHKSVRKRICSISGRFKSRVPPFIICSFRKKQYPPAAGVPHRVFPVTAALPPHNLLPVY